MPKKRKLRVAMLLTSDLGEWGGVQEHVFFLVKELEALGHQVTVFGSRGKKYRFKNFRCVGKVLSIPTPNGNQVPIMFGENVRAALRDINSEFDVLHIQEPYAPFVPYLFMGGAEIPVVSTFHSAWSDYSSARLMELLFPLYQPFFEKYLKAVMYVSSISQLRWSKLIAETVPQRVIFNGVDSTIFVPKAKKKKSKYIRLLFLARLVPRKGLQYVLQALLELQDEFPQLRLDVVGDGPQRSKMETYVQQHELTRLVRFVGPVSVEKKVTFFQNADIFMAPYQDEGLGITVLEALFCACPVVGFDITAFQDTLGNYPDKSLLVKPGNVAALTQALRSLLLDEKKRQELGAWCKQERKNYSWKKIAKTTEQMYLQILGA